MQDTDDKHFNKVFYFICGICFLVFFFDICVVFLPISTVGQKYADNLLGALNTGALMGCVGYLLGGGPANKKTDNIVGNSDTTNITAK